MVGYELSAEDRGDVDAMEPLINKRHFEVTSEENQNGEEAEEENWSKILDKHRMNVWVRDATAEYFPGDKPAS